MQAACPSGGKRRRDEHHEDRKAQLRRDMAERRDELRAQGQTLRRDVMRSSAGRAYGKAPADGTCRRCGITRDGHTALGRGSLEKHHVLPICDGGHPTDPDNLFTLCYFCHREWHTWWEDRHEWLGYLHAAPYRVGVTRVREREGPFHREGCQRCGITERRCVELRGSGGARGSGGSSRRTCFQPFEPVHRERDRTLLICYWCQREWEVFWRFIRPDTAAFRCALPFKPTPAAASLGESCAHAWQHAAPPPGPPLAGGVFSGAAIAAATAGCSSPGALSGSRLPPSASSAACGELQLLARGGFWDGASRGLEGGGSATLAAAPRGGAGANVSLVQPPPPPQPLGTPPLGTPPPHPLDVPSLSVPGSSAVAPLLTTHRAPHTSPVMALTGVPPVVVGAATAGSGGGGEEGAPGSDLVPEEVWRGGVAAVLAWLDRGGQVNATYTRPRGSLSGFTLLMMAASLGEGGLIDLLVRRGAEVGQQTACGKTALMIAAHSGGRCAIVEKLLQYGACVGQQDTHGFTALMSASRAGHERVVDTLLRHGAEVDQQDGKGRTALMKAAYWNHNPTVRRLLRAGADMTLHDVDGKTALEHAEDKGRAAIIDVFNEAALEGSQEV